MGYGASEIRKIAGFAWTFSDRIIRWFPLPTQTKQTTVQLPFPNNYDEKVTLQLELIHLPSKKRIQEVIMVGTY